MILRPIACGFFALTAAVCTECRAAGPGWTVVLRAGDFVVGPDLQKLSARRWAWNSDGGQFEVAVRKSAIPVPAPQCRMEYLILKMPAYYPENPAQATPAERQAVYDALMKIRKEGKGALKVRFDALWYSRQGSSGTELTTCNIYFSLPLDRDAAKVLP
jgi:hypothetical protein